MRRSGADLEHDESTENTIVTSAARSSREMEVGEAMALLA
jgi:hypothetical protein